MQTALLLIDVQQSFRLRPYWSDEHVAAFLDRCNALVAACVKAKVPVVRILHVEGPKNIDNPFAVESGQVRPLDGLIDFPAAAEFQKSRHSALVGTGLGVWLHQQGIQKLIVAGIRTEQCCETTTRHASDEGWTVQYVSEATLTFDMQTLDGKLLPAMDIVKRTEAVLKDRFAQICTTAEIEASLHQ
ncbi:MAG: isochorismatase family protein [Rhizobacter sp.]